MPNEKIKMVFKIQPQKIENEYKTRNIKETDISEIGAVMLDAYKDTVDDEGETLADACCEIENVLKGKYGEFISEASYLVEVDHKISSVILLSLFEGKPLITYVFTSKKNTGKGMAKYLIQKSMNSLFEFGYEELILFVTKKNNDAIRLYEKIGFEDI